MQTNKKFESAVRVVLTGTNADVIEELQGQQPSGSLEELREFARYLFWNLGARKLSADATERLCLFIAGYFGTSVVAQLASEQMDFVRSLEIDERRSLREPALV